MGQNLAAILGGQPAQQQQQGNPLQSLLGAAPQVNVPQQIQQQSPLQAGLMGLLSFFNPQLSQQLTQGRQQRQAQNTANIQRAQATNVGLRSQREGQIARLEQRQREFDVSTKAAKEDRAIRRAAEDRLERLAETSNELRREQIRVSKEGQNQFTRSQEGNSDIAFGGFRGELGALTGEAASASGRSGKLLADDMMAAWREAGGENNPSAALDAAMNIWDQGVERGQLLATTIGMLPNDITKAIELLEEKMGKQMDIFNDKLTIASQKGSRRTKDIGLLRRRLRTPEVHKRIRFESQ